MKKENKENKKALEQKELDKQFKKKGNICLGIIVGCFIVMFIVSRQGQGQSWLPIVLGFLGVVMAGAFVYSLLATAKRLKQNGK